MEINELYRRVRNVPIYFRNDGSLSSAIYNDSEGASVDVDDNRPLDEIVRAEENLHDFYNQQRMLDDPEGEYKLVAIGSVSANICDNLQVIIELDPIENINPYHAILKRSEGKAQLTHSQCKKLVENTKIVKSYGNADPDKIR